MAFRNPDPSREESAGLRNEVRSFLEESSEHLRTRGELLGIEAREAADIWSRKGRLLATGVLFLATGYVLVITALVGVIGSLLASASVSLANWMGASLILALLNFVAGIALLVKARNIGRGTPVFGATLNELRKDQQWLSREKTN